MAYTSIIVRKRNMDIYHSPLGGTGRLRQGHGMPCPYNAWFHKFRATVAAHGSQ